MGALLPLLPIIEDLLTYYTVQALVEALVEAGIIPAELAPLLGAQLPDVSGTFSSDPAPAVDARW